MGIVVYSPYYGVMQDFDPQPRSSHISSRSAWGGLPGGKGFEGDHVWKSGWFSRLPRFGLGFRV